MMAPFYKIQRRRVRPKNSKLRTSVCIPFPAGRCGSGHFRLGANLAIGLSSDHAMESKGKGAPIDWVRWKECRPTLAPPKLFTKPASACGDADGDFYSQPRRIKILENLEFGSPLEMISVLSAVSRGGSTGSISIKKRPNADTYVSWRN